MTTNDPFELAAEREQEIKREGLMHRRRDHPSMRSGSLLFLGLWALFLTGHYILLGAGVLFFIHASVFALFVVMLTVPMLTPSAAWAPILVAHVHYQGWTTLAKLHLLVFVAFLMMLAFARFESRKWMKRRKQHEVLL
jgi:hypothetical protein